MLSGQQKEYVDEAGRQPKALRVGAGWAAAEAKVDANYQGLPARFEIPEGERHSYFGQAMLPTGREQAVHVLLVSSTIVWLIGMLFVAFATTLLWRSRTMLAEGLRDRLTPEVAEPVVAEIA